VPSATPSLTPSVSPSVKPSVSPSTSPSSAPTYDCIPNIQYTFSGPDDRFNFEPIGILWHDTENVIISVSQTWSESPICYITTHYLSSESLSWTCDTKGNVEAGEFAYYKLKCDATGFAEATIYLQDAMISNDASITSVPMDEGCDLLQSSYEAGSETSSVHVKIPCQVESYECPAPAPEVCDGNEDMWIEPEVDFENGEALTWWYGSEAKLGQSTHLVADGSVTTKTFDVPVDSLGVEIRFQFYEEANLESMIFRLQGQEFNLGSFNTQVVEDYTHGYLGDIWSVVEGISLTSNSVKLVMKTRWYPTGRLSIAFGDNVGIDNFSVYAICSDLEPYYGPEFTPAPSSTPSIQPSVLPSSVPSVKPSAVPSTTPSVRPSAAPSATPSASPSALPSLSPSATPSATPSAIPTAVPSVSPSAIPSTAPSAFPSALPSALPSTVPTASPSTTPSAQPTVVPSAPPSAAPSEVPSASPTSVPSVSPSAYPSSTPSVTPTLIPSVAPSMPPSGGPSSVPSIVPTIQPSAFPSSLPSIMPSAVPSVTPSSAPSDVPSSEPSALPSVSPSTMPSAMPSSLPSATPSVTPTAYPSAVPSGSPTAYPSARPSALPSARPSTQPSVSPSVSPSTSPSQSPSDAPSASPTTDCIANILYIPSGPMYVYEPISILWYDAGSVVIGVSQSWSDSPVCLVSVYYESSETQQMACDTKGQVDAGEFAYYKLQCNADGYATATIYLQDVMFAETPSVTSVPAECSLLQAGRDSGASTISYDVQIPCMVESQNCPEPAPLLCDGSSDVMVVEPKVTFEDGEASMWWYGAEGHTSEFTTYLKAAVSATTKTFSVPMDSSAVIMQFSFYEETDLVPLMIAIQGQDFILGNFSTSVAELRNEGFLGDIWSVIESTSLRSNTAMFVIPARWYPTGRLAVSFGPNVGIDNFSLDSVCSSIDALGMYPTYTDSPTTKPTVKPTIKPTQMPTGTPSVSPTVGPTKMPSAVPTKAPTSQPTVDCIPNVVYLPEGTQFGEFSPINILSQDTNTVTFSVSQVWSPDEVCLVSTEYPSAETLTDACDTKDNVPPGEFAYYKAFCEEGFAVISMFVQDSIIQDFVPVVVPDICTPLQGGDNTLMVQALIPCIPESQECPPVGPLSCGGNDSMDITFEDFEISAPAGWMHGTVGQSHKYSNYATAVAGEMVKSFDVPPDASALTLQFSFHELGSTESMQVRIQGIYARFGTYAPDIVEGEREGFLGDIWATIQPNTAINQGLDSNKATMVIPSSWFRTGRLTVAFQSGVGVDDLTITAACPATVALGTGTDSCPCATCSSSSAVVPSTPDWSHPGLPANSLKDYFTESTHGAGFQTIPCLGLAESAADPKIAIPCNDPETIYYLVSDEDRLSTLQLQGGQWSYLGNSRFLEYDAQSGSAGEVKVKQTSGTQDFDLQTRENEVCLVWHDVSEQPLVYCYTNGVWSEVGSSNRIPMSAAGDVELLMPNACECSELASYYFVSVGSPNGAYVWFYNSADSNGGWNLLGGTDVGKASDIHIAIPTSGNYKCSLHAVVLESSNLEFARLVEGSEGFKNSQWQKLGAIVHDGTSVAPSVNDFAFTDAGVPVVGWVELSATKFAYLSVWTDYPSATVTETASKFEVAAFNTGRNGAMPPVLAGTEGSAPVYNSATGLSLDVHGETVFMAVTDDGSDKIYISYIEVASGVDSWPWSEYETEPTDLLPQDQGDYSTCSDNLEGNVRGDAESQIKIACNGNMFVAHVIAKDTAPVNIASLAKNGLPADVVTGAGGGTARREEAVEEFPVTEPSLDAEDGGFYCSAYDYPCGDADSMVYVCHYSARSGYQTFCVPEADSEILRFFANDYCGPCVQGFGGINQAQA